MTDPRTPFFDGLRGALGRSLTGNDVAAGHDLLDRLHAPREAAAPVLGLTAADFQAVATRLGCTVAQVRAVDEVESAGSGFLPGDPPLVKILFEAHIFDRETGGRFRAAHPSLSSPTWNRALYAGGRAEWPRLERAMQLDREAALRSASAGRYQIMGFNFRAAGFASVDAFWTAMKASERAHLDAFAAFIENSKLVAALRQISNVHGDCIAFAKGYNGSGYATNSYHVKIARAHKKWSEA